MSQSNFYALVADLSDSKSAPKIIPAKELYILTPTDEAKPFRPKTEKQFKPKEEYGRVRQINGEKKMVRHLILQLSLDVKTLKESYAANKERPAVQPRKSISPVVEPLSKYTIKGGKRKNKESEEETKKNLKKVKVDAGAKTLLKYQAQQSVSPKPGDISEPTHPSRTPINTSLETPVTSDNKFKWTPLDTTTHPEKETLSELLNDSLLNGTESPSKCDLGNSDEEDVDKRDSKASKEETVVSEEPQHQTEKSEDKSSKALVNKLITLCNKETQTELPFETELYLELKEAYATIVKLQKGEKNSMDEKVKEMIQVQKEILDTLRDREGSLPKSKKKKSRLNLLKDNLIEDDNEEVAEGKVKVGLNLYVDHKKLAEIEKSSKFLDARIQLLLAEFYKDELPDYSLSGTLGGRGAKKMKGKKIAGEEVASITTILGHFKWTYVANLDESNIRSRIAKATSSSRTTKPTTPTLESAPPEASELEIKKKSKANDNHENDNKRVEEKQKTDTKKIVGKNKEVAKKKVEKSEKNIKKKNEESDETDDSSDSQDSSDDDGSGEEDKGLNTSISCE